MKYTKPEAVIINFETVDIIATSIDDPSVLQTWGSNLKSVNADDVIDMFE